MKLYSGFLGPLFAPYYIVMNIYSGVPTPNDTCRVKCFAKKGNISVCEYITDDLTKRPLTKYHTHLFIYSL